MQAVTSIDGEEPRKLNAIEKENFSVVELEKVPFKKRLEILFISTIIPSRRQLAFKYGLDEQLIHNVLSHRAYILQNWKYNSNTERLFTKLELENAMAFMELLIEWKRRVELNGLQMTHAALLRKTSALQKILRPNAFDISVNWLQLFNENWEHKKFRDSENDSLEFEDILHDLQWMFTESAFNRLSARLRRARNGNRTRIKQETSKTESDTVYLDEEEDYSDLLDVSDIKAEPLYYNDDDFECEDYEFVMDEELVFDSLRRELADTEAAKYKRFMGADNDVALSHNAVVERPKDDAEYISEFEVTKSENIIEITPDEDTEPETKKGCVLEELQENMNFYQNTYTPPDSNDPLWSMTEQDVPVPIRLEIVNPQVTTPVVEFSNITPPKPKPRPYRRRARGELPALTVRKDCVRLPTSTEIGNFATRAFIAQDNLEEIKYESRILPTPIGTKKQKNLPKTPVQSTVTPFTASYFSHCDRTYIAERSSQLQQKEIKHQTRDYKPTSTITSAHSTSSQVPIVFKNVSFTGNEQITIAIEQPETSAMSTIDGEPILETSTVVSSSYSSPLKTEQEQLPSLHIMEMSTASAAKRTKDSTNENIQRLSVQTDLTADQMNFKVIDNADDGDVELILGIPAALEQSVIEEPVVANQVEQPATQQPFIDERRKQKFKNKLKITSVQILGESVLGDEGHAVGDVLTLPEQSQNEPKKRLQTEKKNTSEKTATKRFKRRTNDSDLTLRRDKVRIW